MWQAINMSSRWAGANAALEIQRSLLSRLTPIDFHVLRGHTAVG